MENQVIEINVKKRLRYYLLEASVYFKIYVLRKEHESHSISRRKNRT